MTTQVAPPTPGDEPTWVETHLAGLWQGPLRRSRFAGGQAAADAALAGFDVGGYAATRSEVWPPSRRGASGLSPYIRHGLLTLPRVWQAAAGPARDVVRFRDELLWQEYARHLYARLGAATAQPLRARRQPGAARGWHGDDPWPTDMACVAGALDELETDGWLVNQVRMWLASQWAVRAGADWEAGEARLYAGLVDGSRAANRLGWQWTAGTATGKPYGFSRWQVDKRAPGVCAGCALVARCPIERWPDSPDPVPTSPDPRLRADPDTAATAGPGAVEVSGRPEVVWLTAESLGDDDPALAAHPELPAVFTFDVALLERLGLAGLRLVFLAECLADLAGRRPVEVHVGDPVEALAGRPVAATFTPVPGWRRRARRVEVAEVHPWPWLHRPAGGSVASFTSWASHTAGRRSHPQGGRRKPGR